MGAYILRRLLLVIPTLVGIMVINFALVQFVPGGPVEQAIARAQGEGDVFGSFAGEDSDPDLQVGGGTEAYAGSRGLPPEYIAQLEKEYGFDKPPVQRFFIMMWDYLRFDFGDSFFQSKPVVDLVKEKLPVSITLGLWSIVLSYAISIPLGIRKAVKDGSAFDIWTSGIVIVAYAIPGFIFAILLLALFSVGNCFRIPALAEAMPALEAVNPTCHKLFPLRGITSDSSVWDTLSVWGKIKDYLWHIFLPILAYTIGGFATLTLLTKNSFLDEIKKQYVITARAKGLGERQVLYGHVFRNAMLIVISSFPAAFIAIFTGGSVIIETVFSLDGLGRLGFEAAVARDYRIVFATLYVFSLIGLIVGILTDLMYVLVDPRIDFERRAG